MRTIDRLFFEKHYIDMDSELFDSDELEYGSADGINLDDFETTNLDVKGWSELD